MTVVACNVIECCRMDTSKDYFCKPGNTRLRQRTAYPTAKQKRKLIALMAQHPQLISFKVSQDFSRRDSQILWNQIAAECNSFPGARKTWRQWRKVYICTLMSTLFTLNPNLFQSDVMTDLYSSKRSITSNLHGSCLYLFTFTCRHGKILDRMPRRSSK